jgi:hypothetical protein
MQKHFYSSFSILGHDNADCHLRQQLQGSFRAKLLYSMNPAIRLHEDLENIFGAAVTGNADRKVKHQVVEDPERAQEELEIAATP